MGLKDEEHHGNWQIVTDVLKGYSAYIFRIKQSYKRTLYPEECYKCGFNFSHKKTC
jgi:predicted Zn-ribbon and HTH transcriptional regulator